VLNARSHKRQGRVRAPLLRAPAPHGARDARVLKIAGNLGYRSMYWTLDSRDGVEPVKTPQFMIGRITSKSTICHLCTSRLEQVFA